MCWSAGIGRRRISSGHDPDARNMDLLACRALAVVEGVVERWMMADPARVYERVETLGRRQAVNSKVAREERAKQELEALFRREDDRRRDKRD